MLNELSLFVFINDISALQVIKPKCPGLTMKNAHIHHSPAHLLLYAVLCMVVLLACQ